jgi:hypothetical protein
VEGRNYLNSKGVQVVTFPDAMQRDMRNVVKPIIDTTIGKLEAKGQPARQLYDALLKSGAR